MKSKSSRDMNIILILWLKSLYAFWHIKMRQRTHRKISHFPTFSFSLSLNSLYTLFSLLPTRLLISLSTHPTFTLPITSPYSSNLHDNTFIHHFYLFLFVSSSMSISVSLSAGEIDGYQPTSQRKMIASKQW